MKQRTFVGFALLLLSTYFSAAARAQPAQKSFEQQWQAHQKASQARGPIQPGCEPFVVPAQGQRRGSLLLYHGYTACPQQYVDFAHLMAAQGYRVIVPLLPGHGHKYLNPHPLTFNQWAGDDIAAMPGANTIERYYAFTDTMSHLLAQETGERIVGGLSLGGSLALHTVWKHPDLAQRAFALSPLLDVAAPGRFLVPILGPVIPYQRLHWGASCEEERRLGRAGYCDHQLRHVRAIQKIGQAVQTHFDEISIPVQIAGVEKDGAASNTAIATSHRDLPHQSTCLFPAGTNHSMLSPQDNPHRHMLWLPALNAQLSRYILTGQYFDTQGPSEHGLMRCHSAFAAKPQNPG